MKKFCLALTALLLVANMAGCGFYGTTAPAPKKTLSTLPESAVPPVATPAPTTAPTAAPESDFSVSQAETLNKQSTNVLDTMTSAEKREVNLFLSNFSETSYKCSPTTDAQDKLYFVFMHNLINNKNFKNYVHGSEFRMSTDLVDSTLNRFFGQSIPHAEPAGSEWRYENGYFYTVAAEGEIMTYFTAAKDLKDNGNGTYTVNFDVFLTLDSADASLYSLTHDQAFSQYERLYSGTAVIKPKTHNGSATYELVDYNVG